MADLPVIPLSNYGQMLGSYGDSLATQQNAATSALSARAQLPLTQANTQLTQAQAAGAGLANQKTALQLALLQNMMAPVANDQSAGPGANASGAGPTGAPPAAAGASSDDGSSELAQGGGTPPGTPQPAGGNGDLTVADAGIDPAHITAHAAQQYAVRDIWQPQELQSLHQAQLLEAAGMPNMTQNIIAQHKARVDSAVNQAQIAASNAYDQSYAVASAPEGAALATLKTVHPQAAAAIQKIADKKDWTPDQVDQYARTYADEVGNAVHKYSGREVEVGKDGIARDKQTNQPVLGGAPEGLNAESHAKLVQEANALTSTFSNGVETKVPTWRAAGYSSAAAYINAAARNTAAAVSAAPGAAPAAPGAAPAAPGAAPAAPGAAPAAPGAAPAAAGDPVLRTALADPEYKFTAPKVPAGQALSPADQEQQKATVAARTDLLNEAQGSTQTAAQSLQYLQAAKAILDSHGAPVGLASPVQVQISRAAQALGLTKGVDATNYQEVAKYLGNAALQNGKAGFGKNFTQKEVALQLDELSPNTKQTPEAISHLIDTNIRNSQYVIDSARRATKFLASGGDPQKFSEWNEQYFPRAKVVNGPAGGTPAKPGTAPAATPAPAPAPVRVTDATAYAKLPPGTQYIDPNGVHRTKGGAPAAAPTAAPEVRGQ